jgi:hypothetical protein
MGSYQGVEVALMKLSISSPVQVRISYQLFPDPPKGRAAQKIQERSFISEVRRAITAWFYS